MTYPLGQNVAEFVAIGTAVRHREGEHYRNARGKPFQSDLNGQDFWTLIRCGFRPVGFVMGNCVYSIGTVGNQQQPTKNMELEGPTQALYDARELAMERMQKEAQDLGEGVLGIVEVKLHENSHGWGSHVIEFFALGTAVVANEHAAPDQQLPDITPVLDIND